MTPSSWSHGPDIKHRFFLFVSVFPLCFFVVLFCFSLVALCFFPVHCFALFWSSSDVCCVFLRLFSVLFALIP